MSGERASLAGRMRWGRGLKVQQRLLHVWTRGSKRKIVEGELPKELGNNR